MKTKAKYVIVILFLCTIPLYGNCIIHRDKRRSCVVNATTQLGMEKQG